ncbi:MAG TPA: c-type cytochrome [Aromatoleum sp.]|uniref:c-type cytochrome n=1 Tax=Aromatoleum sp. TaxID=2307007 RepID=UPI002B4836D0|nr:c-type cytochrome [Aromatoleum sp.]HJV27553.1 c-type cytochrome [Aromatoleum sp.]
MTSRTHIIAAALCMGAVFAAPQAWAVGDAGKGRNVFAEECGDCHSPVAGTNKKGPSLHGVIGRKAGSVADFSGYSDAMRQSGIEWTPDRLDVYLTLPRKTVVGGKMKYDGLPDAAARADVIAYLMSLK